MKMLAKKKHDVLDFWKLQSVMFLDCQKFQFLRVILFFLTKERPILTALKQTILDEMKQSNGIKPKNISFFS